MRRNLQLICLSMVICAAHPVRAAENKFDVSAAMATNFNSNIDNTESNQSDSFGLRFSGNFQLRTAASKYEGTLGYSPGVSIYFDSGRSNRMTHSFHGEGIYHPSRRLKFTFKDRFRFSSDADRSTNSDDEGLLDDGSDKDRFINLIRLGSTYKLSPRMATSVGLSHNMKLHEDKSLNDSHSVGVNWHLNYSLSAKSNVGFGVSARNQFIKRPDREVENLRTGFYGFTGSFGYLISNYLRLELSGGPSWIVTDREGGGGGDKTTLKAFGAGSLSGTWNDFSLGLSYQRVESTFSSSTSAFISDLLSLSTQWKIDRVWSAAVRVSIQQREALQKSGDENFESNVRQVVAVVSLTRKLSKDLTANFSVDYLKQRVKVTSADNKLSDQIRAHFSLSYRAKTFNF